MTAHAVGYRKQQASIGQIEFSAGRELSPRGELSDGESILVVPANAPDVRSSSDG
jgi:hypothetical protein